MATTLTLEPDVATASVLITVTEPAVAATAPITKYALRGGDYTTTSWDASTERTSWSRSLAQGAPDGITTTWRWFSGTTVKHFYATREAGNTNGRVIRSTRSLTGLTAGKLHRLTVLYYANREVETGEFTTIGLSKLGVVGGPSRTAPIVTGSPSAATDPRTAIVEWTPSGTTASIFFDDAGTQQIESIVVEQIPPGYDPNAFTLTRSDSNGVAPVRRLLGQNLTSGTMIVRDSEAALTGPIVYTAHSGLAGAVAVTKTVALEVPSSVLSLPVLPQFRATASRGVDYQAERETRATIHRPIGRPDPLVTMSGLSTRSGRLTYLADGYEEAQAFISLYDRGEVALLRLPNRPVADIYHVAERVSVAQAVEASTYWTIEVTFVEVARPLAPLRGALGWSFADVSKVGSFVAVRQSFATFADLATGARS